ncbi:MAG: AzlD domain-containing protein [Deltaproteobacteria bacterium]|jgi:branched-subunit amino acid transport protein|nr:AzlD domain-containing protein [Deltaproteobacteria bacterium]
MSGLGGLSAAYWLTVLAVAIGAMAFRLCFLASRRERALPRAVKRGLEQVPTAVLAALALPGSVQADGLAGPKLAAGAAAVTAALLFKKDYLAIIAGWPCIGRGPEPTVS